MMPGFQISDQIILYPTKHRTEIQPKIHHRANDLELSFLSAKSADTKQEQISLRATFSEIESNRANFPTKSERRSTGPKYKQKFPESSSFVQSALEGALGHCSKGVGPPGEPRWEKSPRETTVSAKQGVCPVCRNRLYNLTVEIEGRGREPKPPAFRHWSLRNEICHIIGRSSEMTAP
jgi:hypothetical protein